MIMDTIFNDLNFRTTLSVLRTNFFIQRPFLCLPLSCSLYDMLKKQYPNRKFEIKSGNLSYKGAMIFKQDFKWRELTKDNPADINNNDEFHSWVELDSRYIIDLSISWTICSDVFTKPCKQDMLKNGMRPTATFIIDKENNDTGYFYEVVEILPNEIFDGILNGIAHNQEFYFGKKIEHN